MEYVLIWHSRYGAEEIDAFSTRKEAEAMRVEYYLAYGGDRITIKTRRA